MSGMVGSRNSGHHAPHTPVPGLVVTQGIKDPLPKFELKCYYINGAVRKNKPLNLHLKKQRRKAGQVHRDCCSLLKKKNRSNFGRAEISYLCKRRLAALNTQLFGSHSKNENCLFPPTLKTAPHPATLAASSKLQDRANTKYVRV